MQCSILPEKLNAHCETVFNFDCKAERTALLFRTLRTTAFQNPNFVSHMLDTLFLLLIFVGSYFSGCIICLVVKLSNISHMKISIITPIYHLI